MANNPLSQVLATPLGDMVAEIGKGIAQAQFEIDAQTLANLKDMYALDDETVRQLQAIGYRPTWYVIPEAHAEINLALTVGQTVTRSGSRKTELYGTTVDASYQNQYDYQYQASSKLTLKFAPVPAPAQLDDMQAVPNLTGSTLGAARVVLERLGLLYTTTEGANDAGVVTAMTPPPGTLIESDQSIQLTI